jgi:hypothetical protein
MRPDNSLQRLENKVYSLGERHWPATPTNRKATPSGTRRCWAAQQVQLSHQVSNSNPLEMSCYEF